MLNVFSKQIIALRGSPRINEYPFEQLQDWLGQDPWSPTKKNHDSGKRREVIPDLSPVGPNEIIHEKGDRSSNHGVSSGYDKGPNPGGQADDETGPGNATLHDKEQTFKSHDTAELAFKSDGDTSSKFSPLNFESNQRDSNSNNNLITNNLNQIYEKPTIQTRMPVDQQWKKRRAANFDSYWVHKYV